MLQRRRGGGDNRNGVVLCVTAQSYVCAVLQGLDGMKKEIDGAIDHYGVSLYRHSHRRHSGLSADNHAAYLFPRYKTRMAEPPQFHSRDHFFHSWLC